MKQIATFVSEISDEFKVVVVQAIRALCLKFPRKHGVLMNFLSAMLRDEGGLDYKASIADTIITIIEENPDAKEAGLAHLCEFIEDCEHTSLAVRILHLLGREGPRTKQPSRYIRFIYNRVILENATVRCAAVSAMAQFGAACPDLLANVQVLLARCQMDSDDEVRDRAVYYSCILARDDKTLYNNYIIESPQVSISALERALREYKANPDAATEAFDLRSVPLAPVSHEDDIKTGPGVVPTTEGMLISVAAPGVPAARPTPSREENYSERLAAVPGVSSLGPLFRSSDTVELTESETEYVVRCVKHIYGHHVVLQFDCLNTLNDQLLENVRVQVEPAEGYKIIAEIPCQQLPYNETGHAYIICEFPNDLASTVGSFGATLKFVVKDCDPATGLPDSDEGYDDEYMLEDIEVTLGDQIQKVNKVNFGTAWEEAGNNFVEMEDTYALTSMRTLEEAVKNIIQFLGLMPAERSDKVPDGKTTHSLFLAGMFRGGFEVLVRAKLALADGVTMQLTVRSTNPDVAELITSAVG